MEPKDIKINDVIWFTHSGYKWVFRITSTELPSFFKYSSYMRNSSPSESAYGYFTKLTIPGSCSIPNNHLVNLRLATEEEVSWQEQCEQANKFVPKPLVAGNIYAVNDGKNFIRYSATEKGLTIDTGFYTPSSKVFIKTNLGSKYTNIREANPTEVKEFLVAAGELIVHVENYTLI